MRVEAIVFENTSAQSTKFKKTKVRLTHTYFIDKLVQYEKNVY